MVYYRYLKYGWLSSLTQISVSFDELRNITNIHRRQAGRQVEDIFIGYRDLIAFIPESSVAICATV